MFLEEIIDSKNDIKMSKFFVGYFWAQLVKAGFKAEKALSAANVFERGCVKLLVLHISAVPSFIREQLFDSIFSHIRSHPARLKDEVELLVEIGDSLIAPRLWTQVDAKSQYDPKILEENQILFVSLMSALMNSGFIQEEAYRAVNIIRNNTLLSLMLCLPQSQALSVA